MTENIDNNKINMTRVNYQKTYTCLVIAKCEQIDTDEEHCKTISRMIAFEIYHIINCIFDKLIDVKISKAFFEYKLDEIRTFLFEEMEIRVSNYYPYYTRIPKP